MTTRQLRLLRAAAATSIATTLAAVSHTVGGGMPPHPLLIAAAAVLLIPLAAVLIGRRVSAPRTLLTVMLSQAVFHVLFQILGGSLAETAASPHAHAHTHALVLGPQTSIAAPDAAMLASHVIAAAATTALLWHGERMLRAIASWVSTHLQVALPVPRIIPAPPTMPALAAVSAPLTPLASVVTRRGPPLV